MNVTERRLDGLRADIDSVDDAILDLVLRRAALIEGAVAAKAEAGTLARYLRPGREAAILRRLDRRNAGRFPPAALIRIWRELLCSLLPVQGPFSVAVGGASTALWDTARDFYGSDTAMRAVADGAAALEAVAGGGDQLAVVPADEPGPFPIMAAGGSEAPRIVGFLPFVKPRPGAGERRDAFVLSRHPPEESGDDVTLLAFDRDPRDALREAGMRVRGMRGWPGMWLAGIAGFHAGGAARRIPCGGLTARVLGAYPVPLSS